MLKTAASVPGSSCMWRINSSERPKGREHCLTSVTVILKGKGGTWEWVLGGRGPWQCSGWMFTAGCTDRVRGVSSLVYPFGFGIAVFVCVRIHVCIYISISGFELKIALPSYFFNRVWFFSYAFVFYHFYNSSVPSCISYLVAIAKFKYFSIPFKTCSLRGSK